MPDALHVDEDDLAVVRINAGLVDKERGATVNDCST